MKPITNETIFENVRKQNYISEREINLLKNRSNKEGHDLLNYDLVDEVGEGYGVPNARTRRKGFAVAAKLD